MNISKLIREALAEDKAYNDVTTLAVIPENSKTKAFLIAKQPGIVCGLKIFADVFRALDPKIKIKFYAKDGLAVKKGKIAAALYGKTRAILSAERAALNFIQHLSGIATTTNLFVKEVKGTKAKIYDTRKTAPGLRNPEKFAVFCGGGFNHRFNLSDIALIKDNHLKVIRDLPRVLKDIKKKNPRIKVEVEAETINEVKKALDANADIIMLDNMNLSRIRKAVKLIKNSGRSIKTEISGGVNLKTVRGFAKTGVDRISVGAITHSAPALDLSLEIK